MKKTPWRVAAWALGFASVLLFPAGRNMRMSALFVSLLAFASLRLRPWFAALCLAALATWTLGPKDHDFGWTQVLMIVAGLTAAKFAVNHMASIRTALAWLSPVFLASFLYDRVSGFSGAATLDNTVLAGPIFALLALVVCETSFAAAVAYGFLCFMMGSTTGALVLYAAFFPMAIRKYKAWTVFLSGSAFVAFYVAMVDKVHVGYDQRFAVIKDTLAAALDAPLVGHGWSSFPTFALLHLPRTWAGEVFAHAHSDFAQLAYEAGALALLLALAYLGHRWAVAFRQKQDVALGLLLGLGVFCAIGFPWHVAPSAAVCLVALADIEGRTSVQA